MNGLETSLFESSLRLTGRLDFRSCAALLRQVRNLRRARPRLQLDLSAITYIDMTGMSLLFKLHDKVTLNSMSETVRKTIRLLGPGAQKLLRKRCGRAPKNRAIYSPASSNMA